MAQFPSDSSLYLDDDVVIDSTGIHEPRKEKLNELSKKILEAWGAKQYDSFQSLLVMYQNLSSILPPKILEMHKRLPAKLHLQLLSRIRIEANRMMNKGLYDSAYSSCEVQAVEYAVSTDEDRDAIDLEMRLIKLLSNTILVKWRASVAQEISDLLSTATDSSLNKAQTVLLSLEGTPLLQGTSELYDELNNGIKNAWYRYYVKNMKDSHARKAWKDAIEWGGKAQKIFSDCIDTNSIIGQSHKALKKRRMVVLFALACCAGFLLAAFFVHRGNQKDHFMQMLASHDYKSARQAASRIKKHDATAASFIKMIDGFEEAQAVYRQAADIYGAKSHREWETWVKRADSATTDWNENSDFKSLTKELSCVRLFFQQILNDTVWLNLANLEHATSCYIELQSSGNQMDRISIESTPVQIYPAHYKLYLSRMNYHSEEIEILSSELARVSQYRVDAALRPKDGWLIVNTQVKSDIYKDGQRIGSSDNPIRLGGASTYSLEIKAEGYDTKSVRATIEPDKKLSITETLRVADGYLQLSMKATEGITGVTLPEVAFVKITPDGNEKRAELPELLPLKPGKYEMSIRVPGWESKETKLVEIKHGQTSAVEFGIDPLPSTVLFNSSVPASVWLDGKEIGQSGQSINAPFGSHMFILRARRPNTKNYMRNSIQLTVLPGETYTRYVTMSLSQIPSTVSFVAKTGWLDKTVENAELYKDRKYIGRTGESIPLAPYMKHHITIRAAGYSDSAVYVTLPEAELNYPPIEVKLKKKR